MPPEGNEGFIRDKSTSQVLTLEKLNPNEKSKLILKNVSITSSDNQKWIRSSPDSDGWFTLKNPSSNEFLQPIAQHECKYNWDTSVRNGPIIKVCLLGGLDKILFR